MARPRHSIPRLRVVISLIVSLSFGGLLLVGAYTSSVFTPHSVENAPPGDQSAVPTSVLEGGSIIDATGSQPRSYGLPEKTIALTFDDGPDPLWTPVILDVLRKHNVTATFFVLGQQVVSEPEIVRELVAEGNEIGIHAFTHPDLSKLEVWRQRLEYSLTQLAIAGTTGRVTRLLREPYSSDTTSIDNDSWSVILQASQLNYLAVVSDQDSRDWDATDTSTMVRNATPEGTDGAIVLWHDSGGDRSRTVKALDIYIKTMVDAGYTFTTVSQGLAQTLQALGTTVESPIGMEDAERDVHLRGLFLVWMLRLTHLSFHLLWFLFVVVGALTIARSLALFGFAIRHAVRRRSRTWSWGPPVTAPVSVVIPAFNEREGIAKAVRSLAEGDHTQIEVIVVDDGSTDGTGAIVAGLNLPNVRVIRTRNGGKSSALNIGIAYATHDIIIMVDGDTIFEPDSVRRLVQPFASPEVGAVAGNVKIGNRNSVVTQWQHIEYVIGFNLDRRMYDLLHCMPTVPGAIGAFRRATLTDVGGVSGETLAEDTDLTMAICRAGWHVVYEERARAWTEAPTTMGQLWKQRYRWSYGTMQAMWKHRRALRERSTFGLLGLPMLTIFNILLPLFAPLFDILALYGAVVLRSRATVLAWVAMLAVQAITAALAFRLDRERLRPLWALPLQQVVYRQAMYLVAIHSAITAFTGVRLRWQKLRRTGFDLGGRNEEPLSSRRA